MALKHWLQMRGPSDSNLSTSGWWDTYFFLIEDFWTGLWFSEGFSHHPTRCLCLAYCTYRLLVWQFLNVLRRREKNGWGGAGEHWIFIITFDFCWGNGHLTLHNLHLLVGVHQDITPSELTLGSDLCVPINCLSLEALSTAQVTGMWCYKQGNLIVLGWELLCFHFSCCHGEVGGSGT